jgi:hypothetical protein
MTTAIDHGNHENDELFSIEEAAAFLRVPVATMRYWRYTGDGPFSFKIRRHVRYWRSDLVTWRGDQSRRSDAGAPQSASPRR